ncbi:hypothetical protein H0H93_009986 [Arthromyces matolae]|nr:hypothetical protein H0H93_009986 [Arthromyces matolae]
MCTSKIPEFEKRVSHGWSFDGNLIDYDGHGTLGAYANPDFSSIIGGKRFGVAKKVNLVSGDEDDIINGLHYVLRECRNKKHPCIVSISMYIEMDSKSDPIASKIEQLILAGIHVVVAAGNKGTELLPSPYTPGAITVGALNYCDEVSTFSNYGYGVDIWAEGEHINGLVKRKFPRYRKPWWHLNRGKIIISGTSTSAPQVAGVVALIISKHGNMSPIEMKAKVIQMGLKGQIQKLNDTAQFPPYGHNVMAHISEEIYNPAPTAVVV